MAIEKQIEINVNASSTGFNEINSQVDKLDHNLSQAENNHKSLTNSFKSGTNAVLENGGAMGLLNDLTGGYAMMAKDAVEASGLFSGSLAKVGTAFQAMSKVAKAAIISTGIGILVVGLGAVMAYWDDIKGAISGVSSEQAKLNEKTQDNVNAQKEKLEAVSSQDNILKLQGKSEKEILEIKAKQTKETIKALEAQIITQETTKKAQVEAAKRNKDILEGILKFLSFPITTLLKAVDAVGKAIGKNFNLEDKVFGSISKLVFDPEEVEKEGDKTINETKKQLDKLKNDYAGYQLQIKEIDKKNAEEAKKRRDEAIAKEKERLNKIAELQKSYAKQLEDLNAKTEEEKLALAKKRADAEFNSLKASEKQKAEMRAFFNAQELELAKKKNDEIAKLENEKNIAFQDLAMQQKQWEINNIEDLPTKLEKQKEFNAQELELLLSRQEAIINDENATAQAKNAATIQIATLKQEYAQKNSALDKQLKAEEEAREANLNKLKITLTEDTFGKIASILGENSKAGKIAASAQALINTYQGVTEVLANKTTLPEPFGTINKIVSIGTVLKTGFDAIKNINKVPTLGGGGGGASGGSSTPPAPQFNIVGQSGTNQLAQTISGQQNRPVQAFVVGNEVTTQQSLDRNRVKNATFG